MQMRLCVLCRHLSSYLKNVGACTPLDNQRKNISGRGKSICEVPEAGTGMVYERKGKVAGVLRVYEEENSAYELGEE